MCHVFHWDFVVKQGVDPEDVKRRMMELLDDIGAKYPAEHNVGHLYCAEHDHAAFYRASIRTNTFNAEWERCQSVGITTNALRLF